jgi:hypothetical protein
MRPFAFCLFANAQSEIQPLRPACLRTSTTTIITLLGLPSQSAGGALITTGQEQAAYQWIRGRDKKAVYTEAAIARSRDSVVGILPRDISKSSITNNLGEGLEHGPTFLQANRSDCKAPNISNKPQLLYMTIHLPPYSLCDPAESRPLVLRCQTPSPPSSSPMVPGIIPPIFHPSSTS